MSLLDNTVVERRHLLRPRQLTDTLELLCGALHRRGNFTYLLTLAVIHGARLATLDKSVPLAAIRAANPESLVVI